MDAYAMAMEYNPLNHHDREEGYINGDIATAAGALFADRIEEWLAQRGYVYDDVVLISVDRSSSVMAVHTLTHLHLDWVMLDKSDTSLATEDLPWCKHLYLRGKKAFIFLDDYLCHGRGLRWAYTIAKKNGVEAEEGIAIYIKKNPHIGSGFTIVSDDVAIPVYALCPFDGGD